MQKLHFLKLAYNFSRFNMSNTYLKCSIYSFKSLLYTRMSSKYDANQGANDANQGAGQVDHTLGNGAEYAQDPLSLQSGPITRLRAKCFKEALNRLIQENWADSKKTKMD